MCVCAITIKLDLIFCPIQQVVLHLLCYLLCYFVKLTPPNATVVMVEKGPDKCSLKRAEKQPKQTMISIYNTVI